MKILFGIFLIFIIGFTLAGCTNGKDKIAATEYVGEKPPPVPGRYKRANPIPELKENEPLRPFLARRTETLKRCEATRLDFIDFYEKMRASYPVKAQPKKG